jgi:hypothetical protein
MTDHNDDASFDSTLRSLLQGAEAPDDTGFSARVMAALPAQVSARQLRWARWAKRGQWLAISLAACGVAALRPGAEGSLDTPHVLAALALAGMLIFWSIPSRWSRG